MSCSSLLENRCTNAAAQGFGHVVLPSVCAKCRLYDGPARGLGDRVATVAKFVGVRPCAGCQKRREALNAAFPAKDSSG